MSGQDRELGSDPDVMIWAPIGRDAILASDALRQASIESSCCQSLTDVCKAILSEESSLAIIAEEALTRDSIEKLREALDRQPQWSDLPIILLTGGGTSTEASLRKLTRMRVLGNITLLERPLRSVTLIAAVQAGLASRRRQFQTRAVIQELQNAKEQLSQANADLKQFAFAASHDLQEPLRMVNIFTQMLLDRYVDASSDEAQQFALYVRSGVTRMELLLRDLLLYSRAIHEDQELSTATFNLREAIEDALSSLKVEIESSQARIDIGAMPVTKGNQTQISLVFQNLLSNSIKYARHGVAPVIQIAAEVREHESLIGVIDNGIGFDPKYAERIFDLFQRLGSKNVPGTGLGLAICRRIVERNGGRMWAESQPGAGSTFWFTVPLEQNTL